MSFETETLTLPTEYSLGKITIYPPSGQDSSSILDARGIVQIPRNAMVFLDLSQEVCDDLSRIRLVPERVLANGISILQKNLNKTDFQELSRLGLQCLVITFCTNLRVDQLRQLGKLSSLQHLNLEQTPLDIPDFTWITQFPNLKTLLLSGIDADDRCLGFIASLQYLEDLHLTHSKMSDRAVQSIWRMANLKDVNLGNSQIGDTALEGIGRCSALHSLNLSDTRISDKAVEVIVTEALRSGQQVTSLSLRSCRTTDSALVRLVSLKTLVLIDLFGTEVTAEGVAFLKRSLPGCRILVGRDKGGGPKLWQADQA